MKTNLLLALAITLVSLTTTASAKVITLENLLIDGEYYNATVFLDPYSFSELWDPNQDRIFGNDNSGINMAPTFFNASDHDYAPVEAGLAAVMSELRHNTTWKNSNLDRVLAPLLFEHSGEWLHRMEVFTDINTANKEPKEGGGKILTGWVNFEQVIPTAVPVPATVWLLGSALIGFIGMYRRINPESGKRRITATPQPRRNNEV